MELVELRQYVEANPQLVRVRPSEAYPNLSVLKYSKRVFFDGLWNDYLEECRGLVIDSDWNIVSYPFTKVYNYGVESRAPQLPSGTVVDAYRKVNGFMVAVTWYGDDILVSTTGSLDSPYVALARELIEPNLERYRSVCRAYDRYTFMFECVHPSDPHIVPEVSGMYLLGLRPKMLGAPLSVSNELAAGFGAYPVEHIRCTIDELLVTVRGVQHEGFVFYTEDGVCSKIKSPHYLVSKFVSRNPRTDKLLRPNIKQSLDEEYYPLIDAIVANITEFTALDEQSRLAWVRRFLGVA